MPVSQSRSQGALVVLTAQIPFNCTVSETPPGDVGVDIDNINLENEINEDVNQKTGIIV